MLLLLTKQSHFVEHETRQVDAVQRRRLLGCCRLCGNDDCGRCGRGGGGRGGEWLLLLDKVVRQRGESGRRGDTFVVSLVVVVVRGGGGRLILALVEQSDTVDERHLVCACCCCLGRLFVRLVVVVVVVEEVAGRGPVVRLRLDLGQQQEVLAVAERSGVCAAGRRGGGGGGGVARGRVAVGLDGVGCAEAMMI